MLRQAQHDRLYKIVIPSDMGSPQNYEVILWGIGRNPLVLAKKLRLYFRQYQSSHAGVSTIADKSKNARTSNEKLRRLRVFSLGSQRAKRPLPGSGAAPHMGQRSHLPRRGRVAHIGACGADLHIYYFIRRARRGCPACRTVLRVCRG